MMTSSRKKKTLERRKKGSTLRQSRNVLLPRLLPLRSHHQHQGLSLWIRSHARNGPLHAPATSSSVSRTAKSTTGCIQQVVPLPVQVHWGHLGILFGGPNTTPLGLKVVGRKSLSPAPRTLILTTLATPPAASRHAPSSPRPTWRPTTSSLSSTTSTSACVGCGYVWPTKEARSWCLTSTPCPRSIQ